jgi:hypothetical protein
MHSDIIERYVEDKESNSNESDGENSVMKTLSTYIKSDVDLKREIKSPVNSKTIDDNL